MNTKRTTEQMCALYDLSDEDLKLVSELQEPASANMAKVIDSWYNWLKTMPEFEEFFSNEDTLKHAQTEQFNYWNEFFKGEITDEYIDSRRKLGELHARIGLPQDIYLAGVERFSELFLNMIDMLKLSDKKNVATRRAILKLIHLDMTTIIQSYEEMVNQKIAAQSKTLMEMSTPVTQLWNGLLLLPVVGLIDSKRAQDIMNRTLTKISESHAQSFILDISGVAVVDTAVANHLIKITKATKLMGCECIISGVSPLIAQTIVALGIDVGAIKTTANMKSALEDSFLQMGLGIKELKRV